MASTGGCFDLVKSIRDAIEEIPLLDFLADNLDDWGVEVARVLKSFQVGPRYSPFVTHRPLWEFDPIDMLLWSRNDLCTSTVCSSFGDTKNWDSSTIGVLLGRLVIRSNIAPEVRKMLDVNFRAQPSVPTPAIWHEQCTLLFKQHVEEAAAKRELAEANEAKKRKLKREQMERDCEMHARELKRLRTELLMPQENDADVKAENVKKEDSEADVKLADVKLADVKKEESEADDRV